MLMKIRQPHTVTYASSSTRVVHQPNDIHRIRAFSLAATQMATAHFAVVE